MNVEKISNQLEACTSCHYLLQVENARLDPGEMDTVVDLVDRASHEPQAEGLHLQHLHLQHRHTLYRRSLSTRYIDAHYPHTLYRRSLSIHVI